MENAIHRRRVSATVCRLDLGFGSSAGKGDRDRAGTRGPVPKGLATNQPPSLSHRGVSQNIADGGEPANKDG